MYFLRRDSAATNISGNAKIIFYQCYLLATYLKEKFHKCLKLFSVSYRYDDRWGFFLSLSETWALLEGLLRVQIYLHHSFGLVQDIVDELGKFPSVTGPLSGRAFLWVISVRISDKFNNYTEITTNQAVVEKRFLEAYKELWVTWFMLIAACVFE